MLTDAQVTLNQIHTKPHVYSFKLDDAAIAYAG